MNSPRLSIIIVAFNSGQSLEACLNSFSDKLQETDEVIVIDNGSSDGSQDLIRRFSFIKAVLNSENKGFAAAVNQAAALAKGQYLLLLNPDAVLPEKALETAIKNMEKNPRVAVGGGLLISPSGVLQPSRRLFPSLLNHFFVLTGLAAKYPQSRLFGRVDQTWADPSQEAKTDWVPGAFMIIRKDVFDKLGGFDERFFLYYEEVDFCRRIKRAGYEVWYWPEIKVVHEGGVSARSIEGPFTETGAHLTLWNIRSGFLYFRKHHGFGYTWALKQLEVFWHSARIFMNLNNLRKKKDSCQKISLIKKAWKETRGGLLSPPSPWS